MTEEMPFDLTMKDNDEIWHVLSRLPINEAWYFLGIWSAPDGNNNNQITYYMWLVAVK